MSEKGAVSTILFVVSSAAALAIVWISISRYL